MSVQLPGMDAPIARCSSCGAPILWVEMPTGRSMPVDAEPLHGKAQHVVVLNSGFGRMLDAFGPLHRSHWETCPNADQHRRR